MGAAMCGGRSPPSDRRRALVSELLSSENARLAPFGLQWEVPADRIDASAEVRAMMGHDDPHRGNAFLVLTWIPQVRPAYEAAHPDARAVSRELAPLPLADKATRAAYARQGQEPAEEEEDEDEDEEEDGKDDGCAQSPAGQMSAAVAPAGGGSSASVVPLSTEAGVLGPPPSDVSMPPV
jgi:hypothetical protein